MTQIRSGDSATPSGSADRSGSTDRSASADRSGKNSGPRSRPAPSEAVAIFVRRQDGLVTRKQALAVGITSRMIIHQVATGRWQVVLPGIYLVDDRSTTPLALARAATLRWGADVVASHESAAAILGLPVVPTPPRWADVGMPADPSQPRLTLTIPATRRVRGDAIRVVRRRRPPADTVDYSGVRVTSVRATVMDLLFDAPLVTAVVCADAACAADPGLRAAIKAALSQPLPRAGVEQARRRLAVVDPQAESPLETLVRLLLLTAGLPRPRSQVSLATADGHVLARVDFLLPGNLVIEADGRQYHESWQAGVADRRRQNSLVEAGFRVLRTTWHDVAERPAGLVALVRSALTASGGRT